MANDNWHDRLCYRCVTWSTGSESESESVQKLAQAMVSAPELISVQVRALVMATDSVMVRMGLQAVVLALRMDSARLLAAALGQLSARGDARPALGHVGSDPRTR